MERKNKTPVKLFEEGENLLVKVINNETNVNNLENHHYGAMLISGAVAIGVSYNILSQSYVYKAIELLNKSCNALREYISCTGDDIGTLFLGFQKDRIERLGNI